MQYKYVFAYLRLSSDDIDKDDVSNSIKNQELLIEYFVRHHDELSDAEILYFVDDGYTGTNFNRPDFKRMMERLKHLSKSCCIVVKDLSRFGRDTVMTQNYIEKVFPFFQVRFIAINDYYDSNTSSRENKDTEVKFKNLINGIYPELCSKNVKQVIRKLSEQGKYWGPIPPYGYQFSDDGNRNLVLDREAALIVRYIFDRRLERAGYEEIARELESKFIPCPYVYLSSKGFGCRRNNDIQAQWNERIVYKILNNPVYTGVMENHKTETISARGKTRTVPRKDRIYTEGTHDQIVSKEEFEKVAAMVKHVKATVSSEKKEKYLFVGKIRCGYCHRSMRIRIESRYRKMVCRSLKVEGSKCFKNYYSMDQIEELLLKMIRQEASRADNALKRIKEMNKTLDISKLRRKRGAYEGWLKTCQNQKKELYEKFVLGTLSRENYLAQKQEIMQDETGYKKKVAELQEKIDEAELEKAKENSSKIKAFVKYTELEALSYEIIQELVDTIYFYSPEKIEVIWNFKDDYPERCVG